jgi:hypothetical protein
MRFAALVVLVACLVGAPAAGASTGGFNIYTIAGTEQSICSAPCGDGGPATSASLGGPNGVAFDAAGDVVIADTGDGTVRFVPAASGQYFGRWMTGHHIYGIASAGLSTPEGVAVDAAGDVLIADDGTDTVRFVPVSSGTYYGHAMTADHIYTIAGMEQLQCSLAPCGDGGPATSAQLSSPNGVAVDAAGDLVIADGSATVRFVPVSSGTYYGQAMIADHIYTIAGIEEVSCSPAPCGDGGPATSAQLSYPYGVAVDAAGDLVIADTDNSTVRFVPVSSGTYYGQAMIADHIYAIAGIEGVSCSNGSCGDGGPATSAQLSYPYGVAVDAAGDILIADSSDYTVRFVPVAGGTYYGQAMIADNIYAIAGSEGVSCPNAPCGDGGPASRALLGDPNGVAVDAAGDLVIADTDLNEILLVTASQKASADTVSDVRVAADGTTTFSVQVPASGAINVLETAWTDNLTPAHAKPQAIADVRLRPAAGRFVVARSDMAANGSQTVQVHLTPNHRGQRLVEHHRYPVVLRLWVSYTTTSGRLQTIGFSGLHLGSSCSGPVTSAASRTKVECGSP